MTTPSNLPTPFLCSDQGSFAETTLLVRLPEIARRVILENHFPGWINQRIEDLIDEMPDRPVRPSNDPGAPDQAFWDLQISNWRGSTWRERSFLECEHTFYRRILEATRYFQPGPLQLLDPYLEQKQLGLNSSRSAIRQLAERLCLWMGEGLSLGESLSQAIEGNLWGNRADLSLWPVGAENTLANDQLHQAKEFILADHLEQTIRHLDGLLVSKAPVHFLIDNAGFELVYDLALADLFLGRGVTGEVYFHLKGHPTFVSDALIKDVVETVSFLMREESQHVSEFGLRLLNHITNRKLILKDDFFWNTPKVFWALPERIIPLFKKAGLVISKGDANYRRLTGDLRWPEETPFEQVAAYFPAPLLALRVSKSEVIVGLQAGQAARQDRIETGWRTNGRWGVIQFKK
jgi:uncharacterized protein with ATP-grasp and redox domains